MSSKKTAPVAAAKAALRSKNEQEVLKLESNIPFPERGFRDPEFVQRTEEVLKVIKNTQSFVVPKAKFFAVKKLIKMKYGAYVIKSAIIKPDAKFVRLWRVK